jgi:hypothetical protein
LQGVGTQLGAEVDIAGAFQTLWVRPERILVLTEHAPGRFAIQECRISENTCPGGPVWTSTGRGGPGSAWMVEERLPTVG